MTVKFSLPAKEIIVSGENGQELRKIYDADSVSYELGVQQPYARVVAIYQDGTQLFLNPVFRYHKHPLDETFAAINTPQTLSLKIIGIIVLLVWLFIIIKLMPHTKLLQKKSLQSALNYMEVFIVELQQIIHKFTSKYFYFHS